MRFEYDCTLNVDLVYLFIPSGRLLVGSNLPYLYFDGNFNRSINPLPPFGHIWDVMLVWKKGILRKLYLCYIIVYLSSFCVPLSTVTGRSHLRSADSFQLLVPRTLTVTLGPRAFCSSGPVSWNTLPVGIRDPGLTLSAFRQQLKTFLFDIWYCLDWSLYAPLWLFS